MTKAEETIFSKIIRREIPAEIVFESESVLAFRDIAPQAPTHILVIPKKPIRNVSMAEDRDKELLGEIILAAKHIVNEQGLDKDGYRLVINTGEDGGQTVDHLHLHILGGRKLSWPPG